MYLAHPFRVAAGEVVVDGDDVHALAGEGVEVGGQRGDERLALARLHLGDAALVQADAADDLYMIVFEFEYPPCGLAHDGEGVVQDVVQRLALCEAAFERIRLRAQLRVRHRGVFGFERLDLRRHLFHAAHIAAAFTVEEKIDQPHSGPPSGGGSPARYDIAVPRGGNGKICAYCFYYTVFCAKSKRVFPDFPKFTGDPRDFSAPPRRNAAARGRARSPR